MTPNQTVAYEILRQLGGNKFIAMTGSKNFVSDKNALGFKVGRNVKGVQYCKITLTERDTYTMEFSGTTRTIDREYTIPGVVKIYKTEHKALATIENVYDDMLQSIFTEQTGLYTKLF